MKEIATWLHYPFNPNLKKLPSTFNRDQQENLNKNYFEKLKPLFDSSQFQKRVNSIRGKFDLPAYGIKGYLKTTDRADKKQEEKNKKKLINQMSIEFDKDALKEIKWIKIKSKKKKFQAGITLLLKSFKLPERFREVLTHFVIYNGWPVVSQSFSYTSRCRMRVFEDKGQKRLFIEIFGDTGREDLIRAWETIKSMQEKYGIPGAHLFRYKNFYRDMFIDKNTDINYDTKNTAKWRYKRIVGNHRKATKNNQGGF